MFAFIVPCFEKERRKKKKQTNKQAFYQPTK